MPPAKTTDLTRRTTRARHTTAEEKHTTKSAPKVASHNPRVKRPRSGPSPPAEEERTRYMQTVNISLQTLSAAIRSGSKFNPEERKGTRITVADATLNAKVALAKLREITPDDVDVERAACSIAGKLVTFEWYDEAIQFLDSMYPRLLRIVAAGQSGTEDRSPLRLLSLPVPPIDDPVVLTLFITCITHAVNALSSILLRPSPPFSINAFSTALLCSHSLLAWAPSVKRDEIPDKTRDALLTKAYTSINESCTALSSAESRTDPKSIFDLRIYGLSCLLYTTPGTIKSATYWDQVHKSCLSCARTLSSEPVKEKETLTLVAHISRSLSELVSLAQGIRDCTFMEGRAFVQMCEMWMTIAQKGDASILDRVSKLMTYPSQPKLDARVTSGSGTSPAECSIDSLAERVGGLKLEESPCRKSAEHSSGITKDAAFVECARFCGILVKATASLESQGPELERHLTEAIEVVHRYCTLLSGLDALVSIEPSHPPYSSCNPADSELARARGKVERALERMRRAGLRLLDDPQTENQDGRRGATILLLEAVATAFEDSLVQDIRNNRQPTGARSTLTSLVDILFALARSQFDAAKVESWTSALDHLQRAVAAVDAALVTLISPDDAATLLRCISGTLHNIGGTLYAANRLGGAVRFLEQGCRIGSRVLGMYTTTTSAPDDELDREMQGRRQLEEQLFRRYELLGVCHSKIGDRKLAYGCFVESVATFPYTHHSSTLASVEPFGSATPLALKQLSSIVERLTYAATCELFLPPSQISLCHLAKRMGTSDTTSTLPTEDRSKKEVIGALLTRQLDTLESIGHKDGAREAMGRVLDDLLGLYDTDWALVQRARVLVTALGAAWRDGASEGAGINLDGEDGGRGKSERDVMQMGEDALALLARETSIPESWERLVPQLRVSVHLWMALHSYRQANGRKEGEMMQAVAMHVEAAYDVFWGLLPGSEGKATDAGQSPGGKATRMGTSGVLVATKATRATSKQSTKGPGVNKGERKVITSKTQTQVPKRKASTAVSLNASEQTACTVNSKKTPVVDLQPILGLIQSAVHLLGLLGLIVVKVKLLETLKRVCERRLPDSAQVYSIVCVDLAYEYTTLGKPKRAHALFQKSARVLKIGEVSDEVRLRHLLGRAEVFALGGNVAASANAYRDAQVLEETVAVEEKTMPTAKRIRTRVERLERAALACRVFAAVQYTKDNVAGALCSTLQSLRLLNRAVDALARLAPMTQATRSTQNDNPFEIPTNVNGNGNPAQDSPRQKPVPTPTDALSWRLLTHLVSTLFWLAHAYHVRGSPREALYFVEQVHTLAESARAVAVIARACLVRGEVLLGQGALDEGRTALEKAAEVLSGVLGTGIDAADVQRLRGDYGMVCEEGERDDSTTHYERAYQLLDELERRIGSSDGGRRKSSLALEVLPIGQGGQGMMVPRLLSAILGRHIWLLRNEGGDILEALLERLMGLPPSAEIKGEEHAIMGKLTLHGVYERFRSDMFLSTLTESAISLPMGMSGDKMSRVPAVQDITSALRDAEKLFWADLALTSRRGAVSHVREASVSLAMIRALQSSLGKTSADGPLLAARLLDASSAITLHREMLEAIPHKLGDANVDDLQWPLMTTDGSPVRNPALEDEDGCGAYWTELEHKYASLVVSPSMSSAGMPKLPDNWTVIHITLTADKSSMFISRLHGSPTLQPLLFCVPLRGRRDGEEEETRLTLDDALQELREIVRLSDEGTRRAVHVRSDDLEGRAGWWAERAALDKRMQALLENIEFCWLGAFKSILSPPNRLSCEVIGDLRTRLEKVFKRSLPPQDKKKIKVRLDDALVACFSNLSPKSRDEELEDLAYFMLDLYQFHGVAIAISEVDMDQVTVDLRSALEEHAAVRKKANVMAIEDSHTFLVLDRSLQSIPWESVPVLRGQSVSRIPSLEFLVDRMRLGEMAGRDGDEEVIDRVKVDGRKTYYVLNPSGDLKGTEGRFAAWLKEKHRIGWEGIIGRAPSEQEMLNALSRKDLVVYFGHGGGEQYVRSHKIRHLRRCAAAMLWGCSSGALRDMGEFDRVGTPYHYMIAGCPTLIANLWDVTDRDIDKFTRGVFDQLDLGQRTSVVAAVARSRELCKLKYLTGAAPVVYGIPFYL